MLNEQFMNCRYSSEMYDSDFISPIFKSATINHITTRFAYAYMRFDKFLLLNLNKI